MWNSNLINTNLNQSILKEYDFEMEIFSDVMLYDKIWFVDIEKPLENCDFIII